MTSDGRVWLLFLIVGSVACAPVLALDRTTVANDARAWRTRHEREILQEFSDLLAISNLAGDAPNIQRNAASDSRPAGETRPNDASCSR